MTITLDDVPQDYVAHIDTLSLLRGELAFLELQLGEIVTDSASMSRGIGFGKRVGDGTNIAVDRYRDVAAHSALRRKALQLQMAIGKCLDGTYGVCDSCGQGIPSARLEALPQATTCVHHTDKDLT